MQMLTHYAAAIKRALLLQPVAAYVPVLLYVPQIASESKNCDCFNEL